MYIIEEEGAYKFHSSKIVSVNSINKNSWPFKHKLFQIIKIWKYKVYFQGIFKNCVNDFKLLKKNI